MNPDTNELEMLSEVTEGYRQNETFAALNKTEVTLVLPDGTPVPEHWSIYVVGEHVVVKNYTFAVAHIGEKHLLLEPVRPVLVGEQDK